MAKHISSPVTTRNLEENASGLLRNAIDERIVKIRPMSTPVDQLSRCGQARHAGAMKVEYYSVDTKPTEATLLSAFDGGEGSPYSDNMAVYLMRTTNDSIFDTSETILTPDITNDKGEPIVLYCLGKGDNGGGIRVSPVNCTDESGNIEMPGMPSGTRLVRMGRAASELDVQSPQFAAIPRKASNNCQIFK